MASLEHRTPASAPPDEDDERRALTAHASLAVLKALLNLEDDGEFHSGALQTLRGVFGFDRASVLEERDDGLHCTAALPVEPIGQHWPSGEFFESVLHGRVMATGAGRSDDWQDVPADLISPSQAALCLPIAIRGTRAVLIMLRADGHFSDDHVVIARQCAVVALAALAARSGDRLEAEVERLNTLVAHLREIEQNTQQDGLLLKEIVNHLPIGLTVQDESGRFILVNAIAAANLGMPIEYLIGAAPGDFLSAEDATVRREWETGLVKSGQMSTTEENVSAESGEQTWLTSHKPVRVLDQTLLLTSSLEITERKRIENDLATRVHFDELTGFPNRTLIQRHVEELLRCHGCDERFALAFIDLDNFKHINDYYNHAIGDALLVKIAQRIAKRLRDSDMLARISGDEFLLLLHPIRDDEQIRTTIVNILDDLKQPFHI
jgi:cyclic di-GMP phosphodiesterase Gmr